MIIALLKHISGPYQGLQFQLSNFCIGLRGLSYITSDVFEIFLTYLPTNQIFYYISLFSKIRCSLTYRILTSTNTCHYSENQVLGVSQFKFYVVKGGATNRDMLLIETCFCSWLYGIYLPKYLTIYICMSPY